jgi:uncharacterized protein (TIGR00106 family)
MGKRSPPACKRIIRFRPLDILFYQGSGLPDSKEEQMQVIMDLCIVPLGVGVSVSAYVAECHRILQTAGLKSQLHAYGTNIEGDWDTVMAAVKQCHLRVHEIGAPRITTTIKLGTRTDRDQTMADKMRSVQDKLS